MADIKYADILRNQHFNQFAALFSVAMSPQWRMKHPSVPSVRETLELRLSKLNRSLSKEATAIRNTFVYELVKMLTDIVEADPKLRYSSADLDWLYSTIDADTASVTFAMMFAVASTPREYLSAEQVAEITGDAPSTWRARAADRKIAGAFKAGKTWMFPILSLRAYGVSVPDAMAIAPESDLIP